MTGFPPHPEPLPARTGGHTATPQPALAPPGPRESPARRGRRRERVSSPHLAFCFVRFCFDFLINKLFRVTKSPCLPSIALDFYFQTKPFPCLVPINTGRGWPRP